MANRQSSRRCRKLRGKVDGRKERRTRREGRKKKTRLSRGCGQCLLTAFPKGLCTLTRWASNKGLGETVLVLLGRCRSMLREINVSDQMEFTRGLSQILPTRDSEPKRVGKYAGCGFRIVYRRWHSSADTSSWYARIGEHRTQVKGYRGKQASRNWRTGERRAPARSGVNCIGEAE